MHDSEQYSEHTHKILDYHWSYLGFVENSMKFVLLLYKSIFIILCKLTIPNVIYFIST